MPGAFGGGAVEVGEFHFHDERADDAVGVGLGEILDLVEQVIGPDIILWGCHVFCKPAGDGQETPWHQDGHYWPIRPLDNCTVWVALDPSTVDNGCLRVIPGSHAARQCLVHLHEDRDDLVLQQRADESSFDVSTAVDLQLQPDELPHNQDGEVHAFSSICQHRGMQIADDEGHCTKFTCPYHLWSYDLTGRLLGAPAMERTVGFEKKDFPLPALKVEPVDTVGAGDTFVGYLAAGLDQGMALEAAMRHRKGHPPVEVDGGSWRP